uniref:Uncharacterized protein n=1 Tax=Plectus sambesii TaxID=2011161 RepID=A0A914VUV6_9BILA
MRSAFLFVAGVTLATAFILPSSIFDLSHGSDAGSSVKAPKACNPQPIGKCTDDFFAQFGLTDPHNETAFEDAVNKYLAKTGVAGWSNIRTWVQTLESCSGGTDNLNQCVQWQQLMADFNFTKDMAQKWEVEFYTLEYETGPGFDVLTHNYFCIGNVIAHEGPVIQACKQHFIDQQHSNPNATCPHLVEYLYCIERPYTQQCGHDVGSLVCNIERIGYLVYYPDCEHQVALHC